ncbi:leucine-rich repeat domain-containing protein [Brachyspira pilosicoli]
MSFANLYNVKEIVIPDSVITIKEYAFQGAQSIEKLTLGNGLKEIGNYAFLYVQNWKEVIIPDSVISIGDGAFANNTIQKLQLSSSLEKIGMGAFMDLEVEELTIPASVTSIGDMAFAFSSPSPIPLLKRLIYLGKTPSDIKSVGTSIFEGCKNLTTLILPNVQSPKSEEWKNFLGGNFTEVKQN